MQNDVIRWSSTTWNSYASVNNSYIVNDKLLKKTIRKSHILKAQNKHPKEDNKSSHKIDIKPTIAFNISNNQSVKCDINVSELHLAYSSKYLRGNNFNKHFIDDKCRIRGFKNTYRFGNYYHLLLQLSLLVFLCSFNAGFVTCGNIEKNDLLTSDLYELSNEDIAYNTAGHYTHTWAVHIPNGDEDGKVDSVAFDHGFVNLGKVCKNYIKYYVYLLYFFC